MTSWLKHCRLKLNSLKTEILHLGCSGLGSNIQLPALDGIPLVPVEMILDTSLSMEGSFLCVFRIFNCYFDLNCHVCKLAVLFTKVMVNICMLPAKSRVYFTVYKVNKCSHPLPIWDIMFSFFYHLHENKWMIAGLRHMLHIYWVPNPSLQGSERNRIMELKNAMLFSLLCSFHEVADSKFLCVSTCIGTQMPEIRPTQLHLTVHSVYCSYGWPKANICLNLPLQYSPCTWLQCLRIHMGICKNSRRFFFFFLKFAHMWLFFQKLTHVTIILLL